MQKALDSQEYYSNLFDQQLGKLPSYKLSEDDISKIQEAINGLRELISKSEFIDSGHKDRLLSRLEKLQVELHKDISDFDMFWGYIVDSGAYLGQFGENAKPFF